ncbi:unnamed protein product [Clonostachys byssicola]|uniref:Uncharacterized protein n=1 Tax=Clonostachys byssicola TaxID=160290 RepID=A0A9N9UL67_9HYPO|nr:unnamed protein product [Clonostachys byssicola]
MSVGGITFAGETPLRKSKLESSTHELPLGSVVAPEKVSWAKRAFPPGAAAEEKADLRKRKKLGTRVSENGQ